MDPKTNQILFTLLRSAIRGTDLTEEERSHCTPQLLAKLLKITNQHDTSHLLAFALKQNGLLTQETAGIEKNILIAVYRYEQLQYEYQKICTALEKAHILFLPLKGAVIRKFYPEAWMRTSCDIDILVHKADAERAMELLVQEHGYAYHKRGSHDISLYAPNKVHFELHYDLIEEGSAKHSAKVLLGIWDAAAPREGYTYWQEMSDEMYYFYHIAHMARHFEHGGCGIRPFMDLWILDHIPQADAQKRDALLGEGGLLKFANAARKLSRVWFGCEDHDSTSRQMEDYILQGGSYGSGENRIAIQQQQKGGRIGYVLSKIFIPYRTLKFHYPVLQKHPWLTPVMHVRRWCKLIFCGHAKRVMRELEYNRSIPQDKADQTRRFLSQLGL